MANMYPKNINEYLPKAFVAIEDKRFYKHNGKIHSTWDEARILEVTDDYIVCGNYRTKVTESTGQTHRTKEPAIMFFYKK